MRKVSEEFFQHVVSGTEKEELEAAAEVMVKNQMAKVCRYINMLGAGQDPTLSLDYTVNMFPYGGTDKLNMWSIMTVVNFKTHLPEEITKVK